MDLTTQLQHFIAQGGQLSIAVFAVVVVVVLAFVMLSLAHSR